MLVSASHSCNGNLVTKDLTVNEVFQCLGESPPTVLYIRAMIAIGNPRVLRMSKSRVRKESQVGFDERGTGRGSTDDPKRARSWKRSISPRIDLANDAPALDCRIINPILIGSFDNERK